MQVPTIPKPREDPRCERGQLNERCVTGNVGAEALQLLETVDGFFRKRNDIRSGIKKGFNVEKRLMEGSVSITMEFSVSVLSTSSSEEQREDFVSKCDCDRLTLPALRPSVPEC